jgi:hypothetical protein
MGCGVIFRFGIGSGHDDRALRVFGFNFARIGCGVARATSA